MGPIFISHSVSEKEDVNALCAALREAFQNAIRVFNTSSGLAISPGSRWRDRILEALKEAPLVILWGTPAALQSREVAFEIGAALALEKHIIPCAVHVPPTALPWSLSELQAVTLDAASGWEQLAEAVANSLDHPRRPNSHPLRELSRRFTAPSDALKLTCIGYTIELRNTSPTRVDNITASPVEGPAPDWLQAFQGLSLQPAQSSVVLRDPTATQKVKFSWLDIAGTSHSCELLVRGIGE